MGLVHTPPLTIILALALILNKLSKTLKKRCASSCTLTRARRLLWADLRVRLGRMFPASSPLHFTTTIISPPNLPVPLKYYAECTLIHNALARHPVVHTPPLTIILALALILNKLQHQHRSLMLLYGFCPCFVLFGFALLPIQSQTDLFCHVFQNNKNSSSFCIVPYSESNQSVVSRFSEQ